MIKTKAPGDFERGEGREEGATWTFLGSQQLLAWIKLWIVPSMSLKVPNGDS